MKVLKLVVVAPAGVEAGVVVAVSVAFNVGENHPRSPVNVQPSRQ